MTKLEITLKNLGYTHPYNKMYHYKYFKNIPIKVYTNYSDTLIEQFQVGNCDFTYSREQAENLVKAWDIVDEDLKQLDIYMEGNN